MIEVAWRNEKKQDEKRGEGGQVSGWCHHNNIQMDVGVFNPKQISDLKMEPCTLPSSHMWTRLLPGELPQYCSRKQMLPSGKRARLKLNYTAFIKHERTLKSDFCVLISEKWKLQMWTCGAMKVTWTSWGCEVWRTAARRQMSRKCRRKIMETPALIRLEVWERVWHTGTCWHIKIQASMMQHNALCYTWSWQGHFRICSIFPFYSKLKSHDWQLNRWVRGENLMSWMHRRLSRLQISFRTL